MAVVYRCPECRRKFPWDLQYGLPERCPLPGCGWTCELPDDNVISMPAFLSAKTRATDAVAQKTMDGSADRALLAAQLTGESYADMSAMKITDLKEGAVEAVRPVQNDVSQHMQQTSFGGFTGAAKVDQAPADVNLHTQQAMQFAADAHKGPDARAGARALGSLQKAMHGIK